MRAVDKGNSTKVYAKYGDALVDLTDRLGHYCSYCEMGVNNMIEIEHVHPVHNGGAELEWNNFLLSCKYCNTIKSNNNLDRNGYFWPDLDNTDLLFDYTLGNDVLIIKTSLSIAHQEQTKRLVDLVGLDRYPASGKEPTKADKRWRLRDEALILAKNSYNNWCIVKDDIASPARMVFANQIALTSLNGFYSIWCKVFENEIDVLQEIDKAWKQRYANYKEFHPGTINRIIRPGGNI